MSEPYDHSVRNGRLQGHRTILVAEPNVVTERLAHRLCLFDTNDPACTPIYYFQIVVYCCKVAPQRKVALAEINVATYRLNDSTANVTTIFKAIAQHVENCNIRLGCYSLPYTDNPPHGAISCQRVEIRSICCFKRR